MTQALPRKDYEPQARGALTGVRVLDLSRLVAGNMLTQVLGDFGAEVIKVEPPAGDTLRAWQTNGVPTNWKIYARSKKSLGLELRKPEARELLEKLVPSAAMFIESFRPGTLEKMGLAPQRLLELNPKLVIVRISGWGQDGPYRRRPGFGTLVEGMSGFASFNGFADREPVLPPMYLADTVAGLYGAAGVMIALREVEKNGGRGQVIDLPLLDPLFAVLGPQAANYRLTGKVKPRTGSRSTNAAPRNAYRCKDGRYVGLSASTQKMAERVFRSIGRPDLVEQSALPHQCRPGEACRGTRRDHRWFCRRAHPGGKRGVFRAGRSHDRSHLRYLPDHRGPARAGARVDRRLPGPRHGRIPDASCGAAASRHAGRNPHARPAAGRA